MMPLQHHSLPSDTLPIISIFNVYLTTSKEYNLLFATRPMFFFASNYRECSEILSSQKSNLHPFLVRNPKPLTPTYRDILIIRFGCKFDFCPSHYVQSQPISLQCFWSRNEQPMSSVHVVGSMAISNEWEDNSDFSML